MSEVAEKAPGVGALELVPGRPLLPELRRVAREQVEANLDELAARDLPADELVHEVRKRCKKVRALLRLLRPALGEAVYRRENAAFRDASRLLAEWRDDDALLEACEALEGTLGTPGLRRSHSALVGRLRARREALRADPGHLEERLGAFAHAMDEARQRMAGWELRGSGRKTLRRGLRRTYARGRRELARCEEAPGEEAFHGWRKRVKYHGYHLRLLQGAWPAGLAARLERVKALGQCLGDHHDLTVLGQRVRQEGGRLGLEPRARGAYLRFLKARQRALETRALEEGAFFFVDPPAAEARRLLAYWELAGRR
ncbi:MAG: CHAD domain-containing protein [Deltaproteobacteria bacterium]|nr:CHAD domain-containing protein [Deltaproteobacteria bacterium]